MLLYKDNMFLSIIVFPFSSSYGPVFGAGADLSVASHCQSGMECYSNLGHSYGGNPESGDAHKYAKSSTLMGDYNFNVKDYEVFTIINTTAEL